jgi:hypothetical protein
MVNCASSETTAESREATEDIWRHPSLNANDFEPNFPIAEGVSNGRVTDVTHIDEHNDGLSSQVASLLETDIDPHLRHSGRGAEHQEQKEGQLSPMFQCF